MSKHTPGPWEVVDGPYTKVRGGEFAVWRSGADNRGENRVACWIQDVETARLIAAAPDLLAACRDIVTRFDSCADPLPVIAMLRAAIAKAEAAP